MKPITAAIGTMTDLARSKADLLLENAFLRQQSVNYRGEAERHYSVMNSAFLIVKVTY
jgi:hypothetical protein